jgi:hypothetical protein
MPTLPIDWKFWLSLLAAVSGVVVPVWLWQADLGSRSLTLRLASTVGLQMAATSSIPELQLSIDGLRLDNPFLSTLILTNDGSKPIPASDFESPLIISAGEKCDIVHAKISSTTPTDLLGQIKTTTRSIELSPLLINPKDSLSLSVVTSGANPAFTVRARISGVSKVSFSNDTLNNPNWINAIFLFLLSLISMVLYSVFAVALVRPNAFFLSRSVAALTMLVCVFGGLAIQSKAYQAIGMTPDKKLTIAFAVLVSMVISGVSIYLLRKR